MSPRFLPRLALATALALLVALIPAASLAAPRVMGQDSTDNGYSFTWDATEGQIVDAASSVRFDRRDLVSFIIYVRENKASEEIGERLRARLSVGLNKDRVVRYDGMFSFEISNSEGAVVYTAQRALKVVLRPQPGERKGALSFVFDLPSGNYNASGYFQSDN